MADFSKTITNTLNVFGPAPSNQWGVMLWGDNWGYGDRDLVTLSYKILSETLTATDIVIPKTSYIKTFSNTMTVSVDMGFEGLLDPNGYYIVIGETENGESRPLTGYNVVSTTDVTFTTAVNTQTTWTVI